jgi:hypothetical protein
MSKENGNIKGLPSLFIISARGPGKVSMITGKSVHNQRIERMWRDVFQGVLWVLSHCTLVFEVYLFFFLVCQFRLVYIEHPEVSIAVHGIPFVSVVALRKDNNKSATVLECFLSGVSKFGLPHRVTSDKGLENTAVADFIISARGPGKVSRFIIVLTL